MSLWWYGPFSIGTRRRGDTHNQYLRPTVFSVTVLVSHDRERHLQVGWQRYIYHRY